MLIFWIVAGLALAVVEVVTLAFFAVFLAVAAAGAAVAAALGGSLIWQGAVFGLLAVGGLFGARPLVTRRLQRRRSGRAASGARAMIGASGVVTDGVAGESAPVPGHVQIMGERWPARTGDGSRLEPGDEVQVIEIRGATLVVARAGKEN